MLDMTMLALCGQISGVASCHERSIILEFEAIRVFIIIMQVYALTKERDMLRREQNRKSDSSMLLKEKDEIIKAVMAEGQLYYFPTFVLFIYTVLYKLPFGMNL